MINLSKPPDHVDRLAHPAWLLVVFLIVLLSSVTWLFIGHSGYGYPDMAKAAVLGFCLSLPVSLLGKWSLRKNVDFYAELFLTEIPARFPMTASARHAMFSVPLFIAVVALASISSIEELPKAPAYLAFTALMLLCYPEQKLIYETAKQKLEQLRSGSVAVHSS